MKYRRYDGGDTGGFVEEEWDEGGFVADAVEAWEERQFSEQAAAVRHDETLETRAGRRNRRTRRRLRFIVAMLVVIVLCEGLYLYRRWARPPEVNNYITDTTNLSDGAEAPSIAAGRKPGCYTFLIAGKDKAAGLTDTVLVGMLNTREHTLKFYSIPRDTAVNISWSPKKINQYYPAAVNSGKDGVEALLGGVQNLLGYRVDSYAIFDVDVFVELVDIMGGVYFDVPLNMDYEDPGQDLYIHVPQGYQKLNGYDTMCVFRYRSGYSNGDIGRVNVQHDLLKSIASQLLSLGNIPNIGKLVNLFERDVITNLSAGNVMFYVQEFLKMQDDDIVFSTIPADVGGEVHGMSYVIIYLNQWLSALNSDLNPYTTDISAENVDIIYRNSAGNLTSTTGFIRGNDRW